MREERGRIGGDFVIYEPFTLWGVVGGNVTVIEGGKFYNRGLIYGNLVVEPGGRAHAFGNVNGDVIVGDKTKVIISGHVGGSIINNGGRLYIDKAATIEGRVRTHSGTTKREGEYETEKPVKYDRYDDMDFRRKLLDQERDRRKRDQ